MKSATVGAFTSAKPRLEGGVDLTGQEFALLVALATGGRLACCSVDFDAPRYGSGLISTIVFSTHSA